MKIVAVIGSTRKGNTYHIVQKIETKMKELGDVEFEYLMLEQIDLNRCRGCSVCLLYGEDKCALKDERELIERKLLAADGVIFASPNYVCNVSSLMKNFIDRFAYTGHRPRFFNKSAMLVCTSAGPGGLKACMKSLSILSTGGFYITERLGLITPYFPMSASMEKKNETKVERCTVRFWNTVKNPKIYRPSISQLVKFCAVRSFVICKPNHLPKDYEYWKAQGWLDEKRYFYEAPMGIFKRFFSYLTEKGCNWFYIHIMFKGL